MIQILPRNPKPSTMDRFGQAFANLGQAAGQAIPEMLMGQHQQRQRQEQAQKLQKLTGMDLSGLPPEMQQEFVKAFAQNKAKTEGQFDLLNRLGLGNAFQEENEEGPRDEMPSMEQKQPRGILKPEFENQSRPQEKSLKLIPQKKINAMSLLKPALADKWQRANDNIVKKEIHKESFMQKEKENAAKAERALSNSNRKKFESDRDFNVKFSYPVIEENNKEAKNLPVQETALQNMEGAINRGDDVSFLTSDWWADATGIKALRTMTGAQLENAGKEFLLSSVGRAGTRPNQWIEQRILSMSPEVGKNKEANQTYLEGLKSEFDIRKAYVRAMQDLEKEDFEEHKYPKADIALRASRAIEPYVKERQEIAKYRMQDIYEREKNIKSADQLKVVAPGTPLTPRVAAILRKEFGKNAEEAAKRLGYEFTDKEIIKKAMQQ